MDSPIKALKYLFLFLPVEILCKVIEVLGVVVEILNYPYQKGKRKARSVYDKLEK